ncbi:type II secretion system secretin GspD [Phenylobacterium sp.]|uniref:type II secretion system secretin GspD n=1 Tax=Phenylobacterium sp. TaxID=1871053 RepID=UPI00286E1A00|nr:type II secretion system secretin GspD [Phenylobacterium sp.]
MQLAWAVAVGLSLSPLCTAQAATPATQAESYTFAFENADITQVVQEVLGQVGVPYAIDPGVTGKVTFRIEQRLNREQLIAALEAVLSANGVALVRNGDQILVTPQAKAKGAAGIRRNVEGLGGGGYEVVAIPVSYAQPTEIARALEAISSSSSVLYTSDKLGLIVLGGSGSQLKSTIETLKVFDQNTFQDTRLRWFELTQAQASTVATELDKIIQASGIAGVSVAPLKRLNGVIVFARTAQALDEIGRWVRRLDAPGTEAASSLWVYHPRNSSAEALSRTLNSVLGFQGRGDGALATAPTSAIPAGASGSTAIATGTGDDEVRIGLDKETNTLLVFAAPARWIQIQRILNEIDRPPLQVLIEASILEVTLGKDLQFGVDWSVISRDLSVAAINNSVGAVVPRFPGLSVSYINDDIQAAVRALGSRTTLEVVSAPKIIVLDNRTARLQIGDQVPVIVQSSQSTAATNAALVSTVDYRSTGVILSVTPRVTGGDQIVLEVSQEVSSVGKTSTSGIDSPTIQQRRFESTLVLRNGGVVALGGLISTNRSFSRGGVPGLKEVPGIGALFRTQGQNDSRSELIVLLSAKILNDTASADRAMSDLQADMRELQSRGLLPAAQQ